MRGVDSIEYFVLKFPNRFSSGTFAHGERYFVPFGVEALHVVILELDSQVVGEVKKSSACSAGLEIIKDHVSDVSPIQESIVLLCLLLFHVESPLEIWCQQLLESTRHFLIKCLDVLEAREETSYSPLSSALWLLLFHGLVVLCGKSSPAQRPPPLSPRGGRFLLELPPTLRQGSVPPSLVELAASPGRSPRQSHRVLHTRAGTAPGIARSDVDSSGSGHCSPQTGRGVRSRLA